MTGRRTLVALTGVALLGAWLLAASGRSAATASPAATPSPVASPAATPAASPVAELDEETLSRLTVLALAPGSTVDMIPVGTLDPTLGLRPGDAVQLFLGVIDCCYFFLPVPVSAAWSITPADGATIDSESGLLTIGAETASGRVYAVRADVANGRTVVEVGVYVFTSDANPLVGLRREVARIDCATGAEIASDELIGEFEFRADGFFSVTWYPFEVYRDYWGQYAYDLAAGTIELTIENGNFIPSDVDGGGRFAFDAAGRLILTDMWLGTVNGGVEPAACGQIFA